jgi:hypothetical protein
MHPNAINVGFHHHNNHCHDIGLVTHISGTFLQFMPLGLQACMINVNNHSLGTSWVVILTNIGGAFLNEV